MKIWYNQFIIIRSCKIATQSKIFTEFLT